MASGRALGNQLFRGGFPALHSRCLPTLCKPQISCTKSLHMCNTQSGFCFLDRLLTDTLIVCVTSVTIYLPPKPEAPCGYGHHLCHGQLDPQILVQSEIESIPSHLIDWKTEPQARSQDSGRATPKVFLSFFAMQTLDMKRERA